MLTQTDTQSLQRHHVLIEGQSGVLTLRQAQDDEICIEFSRTDQDRQKRSATKQTINNALAIHAIRTSTVLTQTDTQSLQRHPELVEG